ncbi:MAG: hypothetical protein HQ541_11995 [Mariniphaga sp.]|nr:hypothetical protein [Mariniphaga sp.]
MWKKKGLIYSCDFYGTGYAQDAFIDIIDDKVWRIYYSARTKDVVSMPHCIDVDADNPKNILKVYDKPLFYPGRIGTFDDNGITMTSIVTVKDKKYIYYCGWNKKVSVPYALSIGLAVVKDNGTIIEKMFEGPILDRSKNDPIAVSAPCVLIDEGIFKLWYITFTGWKVYNGRTEPIFVIKYATSSNGIDWETSSKICIDSSYDGESFARPWVLKDEGVYKMWFSPRGPNAYREKDGQHYMLDYAESKDGLVWERKPEKFNLTTSESGWDSEMIAYASVIKQNGIYYMLYNGNQFGKTGLGYAILETE